MASVGGIATKQQRSKTPPPAVRPALQRKNVNSFHPTRPGQGKTTKKTTKDIPPECRSELQHLRTELQSATQRITDMDKENEDLRQTQTDLSDKLAGVGLALEERETELSTANSRLFDALQRVSELERTLQTKHEFIQSQEDTIQSLEYRVQEGEVLRRRLHNSIQELKGNIRVFCRVRPVLAHESTPSPAHFFLTDTVANQKMEAQGPFIEGKANPRCHFTFDKCFGDSSTQEEIFAEVQQLVQSALDGYKVCIFAYGQTGSGKTYAMEGDLSGLLQSEREEVGISSGVGIIPRAVLEIFEGAKILERQGWSYQVEASFLEIYNETLRDLLFTPTNQNKAPPLEIHHTEEGDTFVSNLTTVAVQTPTSVLHLLRLAHKHRSVGAHKLNERSSRAHCVFMLKITGVNAGSEQVSRGMLNLIDLSGSERLSETCSTGDRLRETQYINKSLSCLGDVIFALANKQGHVPFRNSKLTYLLQKCLGNDSKTLMIVTLSPLSRHFQESLNSLRFAARVNALEIGTAKRVLNGSTNGGVNTSSLSVAHNHPHAHYYSNKEKDSHSHSFCGTSSHSTVSRESNTSLNSSVVNSSGQWRNGRNSGGRTSKKRSGSHPPRIGLKRSPSCPPPATQHNTSVHKTPTRCSSPHTNKDRHNTSRDYTTPSRQQNSPSPAPHNNHPHHHTHSTSLGHSTPPPTIEIQQPVFDRPMLYSSQQRTLSNLPQGCPRSPSPSSRASPVHVRPGANSPSASGRGSPRRFGVQPQSGYGVGTTSMNAIRLNTTHSYWHCRTERPDVMCPAFTPASPPHSPYSSLCNSPHGSPIQPTLHGAMK